MYIDFSTFKQYTLQRLSTIIDTNDFFDLFYFVYLLLFEHSIAFVSMNYNNNTAVQCLHIRTNVCVIIT